MTFSADLEAKFAKLVACYPPGKQRAALIPMLMFAQDEMGAVTPEVVAEIASRLALEPAQVEEVVSYYTMLRRKPAGRHHIQICTNISCLLNGAEQLWEHAKARLGIGHGEVTEDGEFSIEEVECIGACCWGPALQVGYEFHHHMTAEKFDRLIESLRRIH